MLLLVSSPRILGGAAVAVLRRLSGPIAVINSYSEVCSCGTGMFSALISLVSVVIETLELADDEALAYAETLVVIIGTGAGCKAVVKVFAKAATVNCGNMETNVASPLAAALSARSDLPEKFGLAQIP